MEWIAFAITMAVGQLTPGPDMLLILKNTLNHDLRAGMATIAGICCGIVWHILFIYAGLSILISQMPGLFRLVQVAGAVYLLWIAFQLIRHLKTSSMAPTERDKKDCSLTQAFREGFVTNLANVKVMVLFSSILAPLMPHGSAPSPIYGLIILLEAACIWPLFAWFMLRPPIRSGFIRYHRVCNGLFAAMIAAFAVHLLIGD